MKQWHNTTDRTSETSIVQLSTSMVAAASQLTHHALSADTTHSNSPVKSLSSVSDLLNGQIPSQHQLEATLRLALDLHELSSKAIVALFRCAVENGSAELLTVLLKLQLQDEISELLTTTELLRTIVDEGNATLAQTLLTHVDSSLLTEDPAQRPLLLVAVEQDNEELVRVLLQFGALNANDRDKEHQWTALHSAVEWNSVTVETLLLQAGAHVDARTIDGWTPLHLAVHHGHYESAELLIRAGASVNLADVSGVTPLHIAARDGHTQLIDLLLTIGADIEKRDTDGRTPLHVAAFYDESAARFASGESDTQVAVVKLLLARGADANARNRRGFSVLQAAQRGCFDVIVELLTAHQQRMR